MESNHSGGGGGGGGGGRNEEGKRMCVLNLGTY